MIKILWAFTLLILFSGTAFADTEWGDFQSILRDLHEGPSIPVMSDDEKESFQQLADKADVIISGKLVDIMIERMAIAGPAIPMTRVELLNSTVYKGDAQLQAYYRYEGLPDELIDYQGKRVIALLNKKGRKKTTLHISKIFRTTPWVLDWLKENYWQSPGCQKPAGEPCGEI